MSKTIPTKRVKGKPTPKMKMAKSKYRRGLSYKSKYSKETLEVNLFKWAIRLLVIGLALIGVMELMGVEFFENMEEQHFIPREIKW